MSRKKTAKVHRYTVELFRDAETGGYTAIVPALPGCVSEGKDMAKVLANVEEAIRGYVACLSQSASPGMF